MGAEVIWKVVYEISSFDTEEFYGLTAQEAMEVMLENGPIGAKPLYAYDPRNPEVKFKYDG
jgi:hypothetical protein